MEGVQKYLLSLVLVGFISAIAGELVPKGLARSAAMTACGLLLIAAAITPLAELDADDLAKAVSRLQIRADAARSGIVVDNRELIGDIIKEKCETYIWDKADELGFTPNTVDVTVELQGEYPYPKRVCVTGEYSDEQKSRLSSWIHRELAVEPDKQEWLWNKRNSTGQQK